MFQDKKLRNTFWLSIWTVIIPESFWFINLEFVHDFFAFHVFDIILTGISFFIGIYTLIIYAKNWKSWNQVAIKNLGVIITSIGILIDGYVFLVIYALNHWYT